MRHRIEALELRRLFALPTDVFAQASDTYTMTIGTQLPTTSINALAWGVDSPIGSQEQPRPFSVVLPSGPNSPVLMNLVTTGQPQQALVIDARTSSSRLRTRWEMRDVIVTTYEQSVGSDGLMQDSVTFEFERMVNSYFVPNPAGGTDVETRTDFNFGTGMPISSPALSTTNYMSTAPDVRSTMEFGFGQLPLLGYAFAVTGSPPSTSGAHFVATASVDGVALWSRLARQQMFNTGVYQNRDAQARSMIRTRFDDSRLTSYGFSDSVGDADARVEGYSLIPSQFQTISYTYAGATGNMNAPTSSGWNFTSGSPFNPTPGTAFIKPPTFGPRATPISSISIQFTHATPGLTLANLRFENLVATGLTLTTSDGGLNWTLAGNLAAQQSGDGDYAVKLFAIGSGVLSGGSQLIGSTGIKWTLDTISPDISTSAFEYETRQALNFKFTENVSASLQVTDVLLKNVTNNTTIPSGAMALAYDALTNIATLTFPGLANGILPNGDYEATIAEVDVTDPAGNQLSTSHQLNFFFIQGDADRNGVVNFDDYSRIDFGFNSDLTGFSNGDFNYDGVINFDDYGLIDFAFNSQRPLRWKR